MPVMASLTTTFKETDRPDAVERQSTPSMHLNKEQMAALGVKDMKIGDEVKMFAKVKLTSMSVGEGEFDNRATLDVVEGALDTSTSDTDKADKLFGGN